MRLAHLFILLTVMIDAMGIGLIMPIMPDLIVEVQGGTLSNAALWGGILSTVFAIMQFGFSPLIGNLSDAVGRRPVLLTSLAVMALDYLVMALAGSIWLLFLGRIVGGITAATHSTAGAYMADISPPEKKAANFGLLGAAFGVGFVLGPLIGGLLGELGTRAPFYAAALLAALNAALGWFVLRETITERTRRPFDWRRANPLGALKALSHHPGLIPMMWVYFLYSVAIYVYPSIWAYFARAAFDWSPQMVGLSLALYGISMAFTQGVLIRPALLFLGERRTVIGGHLVEILGLAILGFLTNGKAALLLIPVIGLGAVLTPSLQGLMSKAVGDDQQGELQGVMTSAHALAIILSPLTMAWIFALGTREDAQLSLPGAPFLVALILMVIGLVVFMRNQTDPSRAPHSFEQ